MAKLLDAVALPGRVARAVADGGPDNVDLARRAWIRAASLSVAGAGAAALAGCSTGESTATAQPAPDMAQKTSGPAILSSNESPFGPSRMAVEAMSKVLADTARYANESTVELQRQIAAIEGVDSDQVFIANGSAPILQAWGEIVAAKGKGQLVSSVATYEGVPRSVRHYGGELALLPLTKDMTIDLEAMAAKASKATTGFYINNPNNPTGNMVDGKQLEAFASTMSDTAPVFIDEAYLDMCDDYAGNVMTKLVRAGKNVVICRTFSKIYGMAGQRLGYGIAPKETARVLGQAVRLGGVNHLGIVAASASLADASFVPTMKPKFKAGRETLLAIAKSTGRPYAPNPQASYIFLDVGMPNREFAAKMADKGVLVVGRTWSGFENWTRICVGEDWELDRCASAIKSVLA